jgi:hypothetical protein
MKNQALEDDDSHVIDQFVDDPEPNRISSNELDPEVKLNQYRRDQNIHNSSRRNAFVAV